ncbi:trk system potassium uptake protein TrkA [Sediminihabitans luteus]|uniref:Trk system potassium uptake protein TrkA n=1 Tax=Sediminihabitans luteus TaxID=1138585 RepID=A0A2M9D137_9CELL|nr:TrkA family potassium uptake protein [Sediminihabitans luteus]PJJ77793.1 trk system potassium uptake protein TrkA [Sediminihabitans luteus]GII99849.1 potassium transporter [Sediminihabitans luteus]
MVSSSRSPWFGQRPPQRLAEADSVVVIGLGRFGTSLALELMDTGIDVLGIDVDEERVQSLNGRLTHVVRADATKEEVLRQLAVHEYDRAVVGIGTHIESSILVTSRLLRFGDVTVWAKAISTPHGEILEQLGVPHIIYPEHDMGRRVAHLVRGAILDYVEFEDGFVMIKTNPPAAYVGVPLGGSDLRPKHDVTIVAVRPEGGRWSYASNTTVLAETDRIIVAGDVDKAEAFSRMR